MFFGDEIETIQRINPQTGKKISDEKMIAKKMFYNQPVDRELEAFFITHWVDSFFVQTNENIIPEIQRQLSFLKFLMQIILK